ncbi:MAG TPA: TetR/AcrR family transcriptional regulator [Granulicella sp.]
MKKPSTEQELTSPGPSYHERVKGEKRQAAIDAAMEAFLEHGYERASLQQIASRANVSTATLFKRFPTKAALLEAIVHDFWSEDAEIGRMPPAGDPRAGLRRIGMDFAALVRQPRMIAFSRLLIAEAPRFPELARMMLENGKMPYIQRVSEYLKGETAAGRLRIEDTQRAARQFLAMIADQVFWPLLLMPDFKVSDRETKRAVEEALLTILARYEVKEAR